MVDQYPGAGEFEQFPVSPEEGTATGTEFGTDTGTGAVQPEGSPEEWRKAYENRSSWERSLKQKDQRYGNVRRVLETAFGRPFDQWNNVDMTDLQAFAMINQKVRTDPEFAKRWHSALTNTFQESGATREEAKAQATQVVEAAKQGAPTQQVPQQQPQPQVPKEILDRLNRMEQIAVQQEMGRLEGNLWDELDSQIGQVAPDLAEDYGSLLEEQVLHGLFFHSDVELMQRAQNGTLPQLVGYYVNRAAEKMRQLNQAHLTRQAESAKAKKAAAAPTPFGAATSAPANPEVENMTLEQMSRRMKQALAAAEGE